MTGRPPAAVILTPGASADRDHVTLVALEQGLPELEVVRLTLGTTSVARAQKLIVAEAEALAERIDVDPREIALGGRSFGGRACSMAVAGGLPAWGLLMLSYPLHPPGKPDALRVEHFADIDVPALFVSGRSDPFGKPEEFARHLLALRGPVVNEWVEGGHAPKGKDPEIIEIVRRFLNLDGL